MGERGYHVKNYNCSQDQLTSCPGTAGAACPACVASPVVIPHFTFSDKMVYVSIWSPVSQEVSLTVTIHEMHQNTLSADTPTVVPACPGETVVDGVVTEVCSGRGSCVDFTCY